MANIDNDDLRKLRNLAKNYGGMTPKDADAFVVDCEWIEICKGDLEQLK